MLPEIAIAIGAGGRAVRIRRPTRNSSARSRRRRRPETPRQRVSQQLDGRDQAGRRFPAAKIGGHPVDHPRPEIGRDLRLHADVAHHRQLPSRRRHEDQHAVARPRLRDPQPPERRARPRRGRRPRTRSARAPRESRADVRRSAAVIACSTASMSMPCARRWCRASPSPRRAPAARAAAAARKSAAAAAAPAAAAAAPAAAAAAAADEHEAARMSQPPEQHDDEEERAG